MTAPGKPEGPRRFLIAAAMAHYPKNRDWDRPDLLEARRRIVKVFTRRLGYEVHNAVDLNPTKGQLSDALHDFCASPQRREDDLLTVYLSGHGVILDDGGEHVLLTCDTDPDDLAYTALRTADLTEAMLRGTRIRKVLLLLDACYAGQGGNQLAAAALDRRGSTWAQPSGSGLVIVSSAQPHQQAQAGLFPTLLDAAVSSLSVAGHGPHNLALDALVQHINDAPERPAYQRISLSMVGLDGESPPFFPNPRHATHLTEVDLALQQAAAFDEQDRRRETEFSTRLLVRAMGYQGQAAVPAWWFTGRHTALHDLAAWLHAPASGVGAGCRVVTAGPGSGKTAVLGLIAALTHPERRRAVPSDALGLPPKLFDSGSVDAAVYAQRLSDIDVLHAIAAAARITASTMPVLLQALQEREQPLTVLIDALDEAETPETLCTGILRPLIKLSRGHVRLLLGTRPYLLPHLDTAPEHVIDLDSDHYADPQALTAYAARTLLDANRASPYRECLDAVRPVASAVAHAAGRSFLIARITGSTLAADEAVVPDPSDPLWLASLPRHAGDAMREDLHRRLGPEADRAIDLLRPLAFAQGQGLPWEDIWAPLATEISGAPYSYEDLMWLRRAAGSYVVEATEDGRSAYRLYHQAMAEYLSDGIDPVSVHAAYARVLSDRVPYRTDGTRDWSRAHPYALRHLAYHATQASLLDQALADSDYLVHAAPRSLIPHLHHARSDSARLTSAIYRTGLEHHHAASATARCQILALDAARAGAHDLHRALCLRIPSGHWAPVWATGQGFTPALRDTLTGHGKFVQGLACTALDGVPVAVTAGADQTVRIWNLRTGQPLGKPLTGHTGGVEAVACTTLDGDPVALTAAYDGTVRIWDLRTGQPLGEPLTGHTGQVRAVACTDIDGVPVAVTGSWDKTVRIWNLATGKLVRKLPHPRWDNIDAVACTDLDGVPIAVTGSWDQTVRIWNLRTQQPIGEPLTGHTGRVQAVACTSLDGVPVAVSTGDDGTVRIWELRTRQFLSTPVTGHSNLVEAVASTDIDGGPVAVSTSWDNTVRIWNLRTQQPIGEPLTGHTLRVRAAACTVLDGDPVAVTAAYDSTVRIWDLRTRQPVGDPFTGHTAQVSAVAITALNGVPVAVTGSLDKTVRIWDLRTRKPLGDPLTGHTQSVEGVACIALDHEPVAVSASQDRTVRVWNLRTHKPEGKPLTGHTSVVSAVACTDLDGIPVAITGGWDETVRIWDLRTRQPLGEPLTGHTGRVEAIACTTLGGVPAAVIASWDATVRIWNLHTRECVALLHLSDPHAVAFTAEGELLVGFHQDIAVFRQQRTSKGMDLARGMG